MKWLRFLKLNNFSRILRMKMAEYYAIRHLLNDETFISITDNASYPLAIGKNLIAGGGGSGLSGTFLTATDETSIYPDSIDIGAIGVDGSKNLLQYNISSGTASFSNIEIPSQTGFLLDNSGNVEVGTTINLDSIQVYDLTVGVDTSQHIEDKLIEETTSDFKRIQTDTTHQLLSSDPTLSYELNSVSHTWTSSADNFFQLTKTELNAQIGALTTYRMDSAGFENSVGDFVTTQYNGGYTWLTSDPLVTMDFNPNGWLIGTNLDTYLTVGKTVTLLKVGTNVSYQANTTSHTHTAGSFVETHNTSGYTWATSVAAVNATLTASGHTWNTATNTYVNLSTTAYDARIGSNIRYQMSSTSHALTATNFVYTLTSTEHDLSTSDANIYYSLTTNHKFNVALNQYAQFDSAAFDFYYSATSRLRLTPTDFQVIQGAFSIVVDTTKIQISAGTGSSATFQNNNFSLVVDGYTYSQTNSGFILSTPTVGLDYTLNSTSHTWNGATNVYASLSTTAYDAKIGTNLRYQISTTTHTHTAGAFISTHSTTGYTWGTSSANVFYTLNGTSHTFNVGVSQYALYNASEFAHLYSATAYTKLTPTLWESKLGTYVLNLDTTQFKVFAGTATAVFTQSSFVNTVGSFISTHNTTGYTWATSVAAVNATLTASGWTANTATNTYLNISTTAYDFRVGTNVRYQASTTAHTLTATSFVYTLSASSHSLTTATANLSYVLSTNHKFNVALNQYAQFDSAAFDFFYSATQRMRLTTTYFEARQGDYSVVVDAAKVKIFAGTASSTYESTAFTNVVGSFTYTHSNTGYTFATADADLYYTLTGTAHTWFTAPLTYMYISNLHWDTRIGNDMRYKITTTSHTITSGSFIATYNTSGYTWATSVAAVNATLTASGHTWNTALNTFVNLSTTAYDARIGTNIRSQMSTTAHTRTAGSFILTHNTTGYTWATSVAAVNATLTASGWTANTATNTYLSINTTGYDFRVGTNVRYQASTTTHTLTATSFVYTLSASSHSLTTATANLSYVLSTNHKFNVALNQYAQFDSAAFDFYYSATQRMRLTTSTFEAIQGTFSIGLDAAKFQIVAGTGASATFEGSTFTFDVVNFTYTHDSTGYTWGTSAAAVNATLTASGHTWNTALNTYVNLSTTAYDASIGANVRSQMSTVAHTRTAGSFILTHNTSGYTWATSVAAVNATLTASGHTWNTATNTYVNLSTTAYDARIGTDVRTQMSATEMNLQSGVYYYNLSTARHKLGTTANTELFYLMNGSTHIFAVDSTPNDVYASFSTTEFIHTHTATVYTRLTPTTYEAKVGTSRFYLDSSSANIQGGSKSITLNSTGVTIDVASTLFVLSNLQSGTGTTVVISAGGDVRRLTSSLRYKKDISDLEIDTSKIYQLVNKSFTYKDSNERTFGLIAEEVDEILPELVFYDMDGNPDSLNYNGIPLLLIEELKKLKAKIEDLEIEIQSLKGVTNE